MLSTYTWNNAGGADFDTAADWTGPNNSHAVPGPGDDAVIPEGVIGTITVSASTTVNSLSASGGTTFDITSGTFDVLNSINIPNTTIGNLNISAGASFTTSAETTTLVGSGTIAGNLNVSTGATLVFSNTGNGEVLDAGATLTGAGTFNAQSDLYINASITAPTHLLLDSPNSDEIDGPGTLTVPSGATLDWQNGSMEGLGGVTNIASGATLLLDGASTSADYLQDRTLNNAGSTTYSSAGSLTFVGQATLNNSGAFAITNDTTIGASGGTINNSGSFTKTSPSGVGTTTVSPTFNNSGTVTATSGILDINGNGIDTGDFNDPSTAGSIEVTSDSGYDLNAGATFTGAGALQLDSGNGVTINSSLTFPNLTVNFGVVEGAGSIYITGTLSTNAAGFENTGSLNISSAANLTIYGANTTTTFVNLTVNDAGATTLSGTDSFALAGAAVFNNSGTFTIENDDVTNAGGAFSLNNATFNNTGTLLKTSPSGPSGLTDISGGIFKNTGKVSAVSGQLQLDVQGTNTGDLDAESNATLLLTNLMNLNSGSSLTGTGVIENGNGTTTGTGNITVNGNVSATRLKFINQTLTVSPGDTFTVTTFTFAGGTIQGTGTLAIPANGLIGFSSASTMSITGTTLAVAGTATWTGTGSINLASGAVISINAGAAFNVTSDEAITGGSGGTLNLYGSLVKTSLTGVGTTNIGVPTNILPGGSINLQTGNLSTENLINVGTISLGSQTVLDVSGTYTQPNAGTLNVAIGGSPASALYGQLDATSTGSINGSLKVTLANGYVPTVGQTYPIMTFLSRAGAFTSVTLPNNGIANVFTNSPQLNGINLNTTISLPTAPVNLIIYPPDDTSGPGVTAIHQPRLTGQAQPNLQIQIFNASMQLVGTGKTGPAGYFIASMLTSLSPGTYTFTAKAIDTLGDYSPGSSTLTMTITPPPPAPTGLSIYPADDTSGPGKTSNLQPRLTGTALTGPGTAAAGLLVQVDEVVGNQFILIGSALTTANGTFIVTPSSKFAIGTYKLIAVAIDSGGNYGTNSSPLTLTIT